MLTISYLYVMNSSNSSTVAKRAGNAKANTGSLFIIDDESSSKFILDAFKQSSKAIEKWRREGVAQSRFEKRNG